MTDLTPEDDREMTPFLWPVAREIIKTAIENNQNLIVEGCYIPFDWKKDFAPEYLKSIGFCCLVLSEGYVNSHLERIRDFACVIERRLGDSCEPEDLLHENARYLEGCRSNGLNYLLIENEYDPEELLLLAEEKLSTL